MARVSARARACDISSATKRAVQKRDGDRCIICGSYNAAPNAHFIARSQGGLGVEQNIVTLCGKCHYDFDQTEARPHMRIIIRSYLMSKHPGWNEKDLYYRKGMDL